MTALSDVDAFTLRDVAAEGDIREQAWYRELVSGDVEGRSVKHLPDGEMKAARSADRHRMALSRIASRVAFHLPGKHPQKDHGRDGGGLPDSAGLKRVNGKDLINSDDRADVAAQVINAAKKHEYRSGDAGPRGDEKLRQISEKQGFDGKPQVVSKAELDEFLAANPGAVELHRGVKDSWDWVEMAKPGKEDEDIVLPAATINERFRSGDLHYGNGQFGNGTYTSTGGEVARNYAGEDGDVIRMGLRPDAKIIAWRDLTKEHREFLDGQEQGSAEWKAFLDPGRYAAARGWDVVTASGSRPNTTEYLILNRTALVVQEA